MVLMTSKVNIPKRGLTNVTRLTPRKTASKVTAQALVPRSTGLARAAVAETIERKVREQSGVVANTMLAIEDML
jgi:hypothetical protein